MGVCRQAADAACLALSALVREMQLRTDQNLRVREVRRHFANLDELNDKALEVLRGACHPRG